MIKWNDWNTIVDLVSEGVHRVIDYNHVFHSTIRYNPEVFDIVAFRCLNAVLSVQSILEKLVLRVDVVKNRIGVDLVRRRENNHLERLVCLLQALHQVGPKIDTSTNSLFPWEIYFKKHIGVLCLNVIDAVDQSLIHIEYKALFVFRLQRFRQVD